MSGTGLPQNQWPDQQAAPSPPPRSPGAERMARHRRRRRNGMRCLFIELRETEIDQLIRRKLLAPNSRNDLGALRKALYAFFDDTLR